MLPWLRVWGLSQQTANLAEIGGDYILVYYETRFRACSAGLEDRD